MLALSCVMLWQTHRVHPGNLSLKNMEFLPCVKFIFRLLPFSENEGCKEHKAEDDNPNKKPKIDSGLAIPSDILQDESGNLRFWFLTYHTISEV